MTVKELTDTHLGERRRCLWQIEPKELPADLPAFGLELWADDDGNHLFQFFVEGRRRGDWYNRVIGYEIYSAPPGHGAAP